MVRKEIMVMTKFVTEYKKEGSCTHSLYKRKKFLGIYTPLWRKCKDFMFSDTKALMTFMKVYHVDTLRSNRFIWKINYKH